MEKLLNIETNRDESNIRKIYFIKDAESPWYRAYELSAYYAVNYNNGLKENERLRATRKSSKIINNGVMQIGLQITSFKKYFPNAQICEISEKLISIDIPSDDLCDITLENYEGICNSWKETFEIKSKNKKIKEPIKTVYNSPTSFTSIMKEIIRYDTHNKDEDELRYFINILKEMCANLI